MSRTPEVEAAMRDTEDAKDNRDGGVLAIGWYGIAAILAAEVERLEVDAKAMTIMLRGRGELVKRAETAKARTRELEGARQDALSKIVGWKDGYETDHARIVELEAQNARLRAALEDIAAYDVGSRRAGICPYGCDTPAIAQNTLAAEAGRAQAAAKALAGTEGATP